MNRETEEVIRCIVNNNFPCKKCGEREYCKYGKGRNIAFDCDEDCLADGFAEGVYASFKYLASIPFEKAMNVIFNSVKEDEK